MEYLAPGVYVEEKPSAVQTIASNGTSTPGFIGIFPRIVEIPAKNDKYDPGKGYTLPDDLSAGIDVNAVNAAQADVDAAQKEVDAAEDAPNKKAANAKLKAAQDKLKQASDAASTKPGTDNLPYILHTASVVAENAQVILVTSFTEFTTYFGGGDLGAFSIHDGQKFLAHAVMGFFANGGSHCFVTRIDDAGSMQLALDHFAAEDEIAMVAAPGVTDPNTWTLIQQHCAILKDRFAILDTAIEPAATQLGDLEASKLTPENPDNIVPQKDKNTAVYFPWLEVVDPAWRVIDPENKSGLGNGKRSSAGYIFVPPSGYMAGVYARTDTERGVHKAPANTPVRGIVGLRYKINKAQQDFLNPVGINCIRFLNGAFTVWGGRTIGGNSNGEWRYVNVRRTFINIMEDIDAGTQWAVFEPNDMSLWAKIVLNVNAYLTRRWREGALFGATSEQAFFVKCDAETNPSDQLELGIVKTVIGVAIVRPAEFVVFEISQKQLQAS